MQSNLLKPVSTPHVYRFQANLQDSPIARELSVSVYMCVCVSICLSVTIVITDCTLAKIKNKKNYDCRFWHLSSKGVIMKIILRDLDLLFEGQTFKFFIYLKREKPAPKFVVYFYICHRMMSLPKLYLWPMTYSETVRDSAKKFWKTFADFGIYHSMVSLRKWYYVTTFTYFSKVNNFKCLYLWNGRSWRKNIWETFEDIVIWQRV